MNKPIKLLAALLALTVGGSASAFQWSFNGDLQSRFNIYTDQAPMYAGSETIGSVATPGRVVQRFPIGESWGELKGRLGFVGATDDGNVRGVIAFEWGAIRFGNANGPALGTAGAVSRVGANSGGGYSGDGVNTELRFMYIDFALPTPFKTRVQTGLMPWSVNKFLWQETATGIALKAEPGPVAVTLGWVRPVEIFNNLRTDPLFRDSDHLLARVEFKPVPMLKLGVFDLYQHQNPSVSTGNQFQHLLKNFTGVTYNINNLGVDGALTLGPVFVNFDGVYQFGDMIGGVATATPRGRKVDLDAWFAHVDVGTNVGPVKVTLTSWYASGDTNRNDRKIHNYVATDLDMNDSVIFFEGGYTDDNYFTEAPYFLDKGAIFNKLALDFKASPKLTMGASGMYVMTAEELTIAGGTTAAPNKSRNLGLEFDAYVSYKIWDNLEAAINAGYLFAGDGMDAFEVVQNGRKDHDIFRSTARFRYTF